ncbi:MAG: late competence development ComFB family protein [Gammaproteobacteria bacterium]|nr:late competence development ComFB family protein [Gammaproteobacteria bacterium]
MPSLSGVQNYYERLVFEFMNETLMGKYPEMDDDFFLDVACYALTRLPARYMRHEIDMAYYLAPGERTEMLGQVKNALFAAAEFIYSRQRAEPAYRKNHSN